MNKRCIAVVGMCGAGKTEVVNFLMNKFKAPKVYFGDFTFERMKEDGLELNYANERKTREKIRNELGMGAYAILAKPKIKKLLESNNIVIAESLYSWDEYKILKEEFGDNFEVIAIYASPKTRFARLNQRNKERPIKDIETFIKRDYTEIEGTDKGGPIARADYTIVNETTLDELHKQLNNIFNK